MRRRALVLGGSGYVGGAVVESLRGRGLDVFFTYLSNEARARALAEKTGARALRADLATLEGVDDACTKASEGGAPTVLVHACARFDPRGLDEIDAAALSAERTRPPGRLGETGETRRKRPIPIPGTTRRGNSNGENRCVRPAIALPSCRPQQLPPIWAAIQTC